MSGMYNMIMPPNPALKHLVQLAFMKVEPGSDEFELVFPESGLGRLRDAWLSEDGTKVFILHRNYGDDDVFTPSVAETPNYVGYHPWRDHTYAWWEFKVPDDEQIREHVQMVIEKGPWLTKHPMDRLDEIMASLDNPDKQSDPDVIRAKAAGEQIVAGLEDAMRSGESKEITSPGGAVVIEVPKKEEPDSA
jgi:hypothetical protein